MKKSMARLRFLMFLSALIGTSLLPTQLNCTNPNTSFADLAARTNSTHTLGYNPNIRLVVNENTSDEAHPTIYLHGFGDDSTNFSRYLKHSGLLSTPAIFFDFRDAPLHRANTTIAQIAALRYTNLGQKRDIFSFIYALNLCRKAGYRAVDVFGFSRGATTALNTLAALCNEKYHHELAQQLGMDKKACTEIIDMVQNGCITLDCPLKHSSYNLNQYCGRFLGSLVGYCLFPLLTEHRPWQEQAIDACTQFKNKKFNMLLHYEANDRMVSNTDDRLLYEQLRTANPAHTYVFKSTDGGHIAKRKQLPSIFHAFKQRYGHTTTRVSAGLVNDILTSCQPEPDNIIDA